MSGTQKRYNELLSLLNRYAREYYINDKPSVSDGVYDSLMAELKKIESDQPQLISGISPTQRVGGEPLSGFKKVQHSTPMISLNDMFDRADLEAWVKRTQKLAPAAKTEFLADIKKDGLGCALIYQNGILVTAATRGDSLIGEDVTLNVRTIKSVPLVLNANTRYKEMLKGRTEIRGEIVMFKNDFAALNKERENLGLPVFANPRNLAAGTIRQLDPELVAKRPLQFLAYSLLRFNAQNKPDNNEIPTLSIAYEILKDIGFNGANDAKLVNSLDEVMSFTKKVDKKRHDLSYQIDGVVISINDREVFERLGVVGKNPRGAVAFKFPAAQASSRVLDIMLSIGRTGAATPIAVLEPVVVAGTTVKHASLHNADEIQRKDIRVGDTVIIFKAGDIIPQVDKVLTELRPQNSRPFAMEMELKLQYPELIFERPEGEVVYRVKGAAGNILIKKALEHFASRAALDIDGLGEKNVAALVDAKLVRDIADIYQLKKEQILKLERYAEISAAKLITAISVKRHPSLDRFIYALGIRHIGAQTAVDLARRFKSLDSLGTASYNDLMSVDGIGEVVANSIIMWFEEDENQELLAKLRKLEVWPKNDTGLIGPLDGKSFVITGGLETMSRDAAAEKIRNLGGTFQSSVAKDTSFLVVGNNVGESKLKKASQFGTKQISETELIKLLK